MRAFVTLCLFCLIGASAAVAGPWAREKGQTFVAISGAYRSTQDSLGIEGDVGLYAEYGLTHRLTLGAVAMDNVYDYSHGYLFLRRAFSDPGQTWQISASLGLGASRRALEWGGMARLGFSLGRSTNLWKPGWWTVSAAIEEHELWAEPVYKLDATIGLNLNERWKTFVELEASQREGSADTVTLRSSVAWDTRRFGHLVLGVEAKHITDDYVGLRVGWWHSF